MSSEQIVMVRIDGDQVWNGGEYLVGRQLRSQVNVSVENQADSVLIAPDLRRVVEDQAIEDSDG